FRSLYDLMPVPFTAEAVGWVAGRIRRAQDILERRLAIENVSYYAPLDTALSEIDFTLAVLDEADCDLLLDVNNVVVNAINHRYDARAFIDAMPAGRVRYLHIAGHHAEAEALRVLRRRGGGGRVCAGRVCRRGLRAAAQAARARFHFPAARGAARRGAAGRCAAGACPPACAGGSRRCLKPPRSRRNNASSRR